MNKFIAIWWTPLQLQEDSIRLLSQDFQIYNQVHIKCMHLLLHYHILNSFYDKDNILIY